MSLRKLLFNKVTILLLLAAAGAGGYHEWKKARTPSLEERYRLQPVERGDVTQTVSANGTLNPVVLVQVGTQVSGTVKKWYADFNDRVKEGQVLLELDPALFRAQVDQSEANVASAKASLELARANEARTRELEAQQYATKQELDTAVQSLKSAEAQLELAHAQLKKDRTNYEYSVIRSPVSGVVVSRQVDIGQTVAASFQTPTLYIIAQDLAKMQIDSSYAEADIGGIHVGQTARFTVDAFPNRVFEGRVRQIRINPTTQQNVVTYDVVVNVDNPEEILLPGMTAYVNIVTAQKKGVLLVPNSALRIKPPEGFKRPGGAKPREEKKNVQMGTVYVIENGRFRPVPVGLGITDSKVTEVVSGSLKEGDRIIVEEVVPADAGSQSSFRMRMF